MILEFDIDSIAPRGLLPQLSESVAQDLLLDLATMARAKWIDLANNKLLRTSQDYVRGIQPVELGDGIASVSLVGGWPNMIEAGYGPYDMRDTLLGPNVPVVPRGQRGKHINKKGGFYRTISFRMTGPQSSGRNAQKVTSAMAGVVGAQRAEELGRKAWSEMKKLSPGRSNPGQQTQQGSSLKTAGTDLEVRGRSHALVRNPDGTKTLVRNGGREHAAPIFEGAVKNEQTYKRATQAFYGTMRTISTSSGAGESWIHPGYAGAHLLPEVQRYIEQQAPQLIALVQKRLQDPLGLFTPPRK